MKIDKYLACKIAGSDFKLLEVGTGAIITIITPNDDLRLNVVSDQKDVSFDIELCQIGRQYKVISRTMNLTKPITLQGKEVVPFVELAEIAGLSLTSGYDLEDSMLRLNPTGIFYLGKSLTFILLEKGKSYTVRGQADLFQWLEKHHFCYFLPDEMIVKKDEIYNN